MSDLDDLSTKYLQSERVRLFKLRAEAARSIAEIEAELTKRKEGTVDNGKS